MSSKPIPGSSGEVLTSLPSPYVPHAATGLLHLPRFLAKCRYVQMGMTEAGRGFILEALTAMGCADRAGEIKNVPDLMDFDEGRIL